MLMENKLLLPCNVIVSQVVTYLTVQLYAISWLNFHLCLCHHVLIRLQVHGERLPHFSDTII